MRPLITRDPVSGGELIVTRLECPASGIVIEGRFAPAPPASRLDTLDRLAAGEIDFDEALRHLREE